MAMIKGGEGNYNLCGHASCRNHSGTLLCGLLHYVGYITKALHGHLTRQCLCYTLPHCPMGFESMPLAWQCTFTIALPSVLLSGAHHMRPGTLVTFQMSLISKY